MGIVESPESFQTCVKRLSFLLSAYSQGRRYYLPEFPARNLTPSPSATEMIWALAVFAKIAIAFFSNGIGKLESSEGIGGSTIS